jgi:hypothetical protein
VCFLSLMINCPSIEHCGFALAYSHMYMPVVFQIQNPRGLRACLVHHVDERLSESLPDS